MTPTMTTTLIMIDSRKLARLHQDLRMANYHLACAVQTLERIAALSPPGSDASSIARQTLAYLDKNNE